ncbi:tetratricopeptide repeat protein [Ureibacillus manganicus]|uniref:Uncharacterized protein n=1 Tax=Ureibacillus manganicus DSM 26584 TaxID=1384049 RepID=A0A0A3IXJ3_9BACL|nr:tetratricopeptide repeat protein [Ureibacillus manganicus]KGR79542.1 hypothetical protein CD29_05440 [Ureibacillus manganicus DSM 26584]
MTNRMNDMFEAIQNGDLEKLETFIEDFLINEAPEQQYEIAELFMQYGYLNEANRVLEHLQFLYPEEAQIAIDKASVLIELGEEDEALELLMSIQPDAPEYPQSLLLLADYYQMQGLFEVAEKRINEAIEILPNEPLLQFAKAEILYETGRFPEACRIYEELHEKEKTIAGVLLAERLAEAYSSGGAFETALDFYMEALEEKVTPDLMFGSGYAAFQSEKYELATKQLEDLKELDPDYFSGYLLLAESYAMIEDNQRAYAVIQEGIKRDEYEKSFYLFAGKIALKNGFPDEAIDYLKQAIALDPEYIDAIVVIMSIYAHEDRNEEIIDLYEELERNNFSIHTILPYVAEAYGKCEQYLRAYEIYKVAYNDFKDDTSFLEKYCYFLIEDGKRQEAREVVNRLIALEPLEEHWVNLLDTLD